MFSGPGWKAVVPNVDWVEFWTAPTGGSRVMPDANGDIIDAPVSGTFTRTLWVSAASSKTLTAGATRTARRAMPRYKLLLDDQAGKVVTQKWIGVNKPVEALYAVDGTWTTRRNNSNVLMFEQSYRGANRYDKYYFAGPQNARNGSDSPGIESNVEREIQIDYSIATVAHRRFTVDMVGWSRGAEIVATIASDLNNVSLTPTGFTFDPAGTQQILVHWLGLFDAVSQMGSGVTAPHNPWAATLSPNVRSCFHLIHTFHGTDPTYHLNEDTLFPTVVGLGLLTPYNRLPNGSTHPQVGMDGDALNLMMKAAKREDVPMQ